MLKEPALHVELEVSGLNRFDVPRRLLGLQVVLREFSEQLSDEVRLTLGSNRSLLGCSHYP